MLEYQLCGVFSSDFYGGPESPEVRESLSNCPYRGDLRPTRLSIIKSNAIQFHCAYILSTIKDVDEAQPYVALSYTWGELNLTYRVLCDGKELKITSNLHATLRRLRLSDRSRLI
jgi:Heterokaryon incompatibility protein (HET)